MNQLFHINTFSQISPAPSSPIESGDTVVVNPTEGNNSRINNIRTATATVLLSLAISAGAQDRPTSPANNLQSTLIAQASTETDGKVYTAEVIQVDGTKKTIKYFRDKEGVIIPPAIVDGKLVDGSTAPDDTMRAKIAQKKILIKYDKIILVKIEKNDILEKASKNISSLTTLAEQGKLNKEELFNGFYSTYIIRLGIGLENTSKSIEDNSKIIRGFETYGKITLKLSPIELDSMKKIAEQKAKETLNRFSSATA